MTSMFTTLDSSNRAVATSDVTAAPAPSRPRRLFPLLLTIGFFIVLLMGVMRHEMWRDEAQSWLIARDHSSLAGVMDHIRSEGHPGLWYICLWALARITRSPMAMQLFHVALATTSAALIAFRSPFKNWQKLLIVFGYFPLFEYGVISRAYGMGTMLVFLACALAPYYRRWPVLFALVLAMMANVSVYFWIVAAGFGTAIIVEEWLSRGRVRERISSGLKILAIVIWMAGLGASLWQVSRYKATTLMRPPVDSTKMHTNATREEPLSSLRPFARAIIPTHRYAWTIFIWESSIFDDLPMFVRPVIYVAIVLALIAGFLYLLRKPALFAMAAIAGGGLVAFSFIYYAGYLRHSGHFWVLILALIWLWPYFSYAPANWFGGFFDSLPRRFPWSGRVVGAAFAVVLVLHAESGVLAWINDLKRPFSGSGIIADAIRKQGAKDEIIIGSRDVQACTIAALLDRPVYYVESRRWGGPIDWEARRLILVDDDPMASMAALLKPGQTALLVSNRPMSSDANLTLAELKKCPPTMVLDERLTLYRVAHASSNSPPSN
jgi:hypothetical protein